MTLTDRFLKYKRTADFRDGTPTYHFFKLMIELRRKGVFDLDSYIKEYQTILTTWVESDVMDSFYEKRIYRENLTVVVDKLKVLKSITF